MDNFKTYEYVDLILKNNVHAFLRVGDENCVLHEEEPKKNQSHTHRHAEMILVLGGTAVCTINATPTTVTTGDLLLIDSSVPHGFTQTEDFSCISLAQ